MLGSGGLGGDEVSGVGVDVVEVGVVVVVVVGVVRRHLLDAGEDAPYRLHVRLWGRPAPRPPPFAPLSPRGSCAPSCLSPGAPGALALALGSLPGPHVLVPLSAPRVPPPVTCALACTAGARIPPVPVSMPLAAPTLADRAPLHSMRSVAARLGTLLSPLRVLPVPLPFPGSLFRVVPSAARALSPSAAAGLSTLPALSPSLLAGCPQASPLRSSLGTPPVASCPPLCAPVDGTLPRLRAAPPLPDHAPGVLLPFSCGSVIPGGVRSAVGGRTCRVRPVGKAALGGNGLGGLVWEWLGLAWARYLARSLPSAAALAAPGEALWARAGPVPRARGVPGAAAWPAGAVARLAGAVVSAPCAPSLLSSAAAAAPGEAPGARARATPRAGGAPGAAVGAAARLAGAAVAAPCAPGAPSRGGAAGLAAWAAEAVSWAGAAPRVDSPVLAGAVWGCPAGGLTGTAASASRRSSRSVRVFPAHPGETGERERDWRWWRSSRWGGPSESDITVILVGMRGGRCAPPITSRCICVVPWAVLCSAPQGGGGQGSGGWRWR